MSSKIEMFYSGACKGLEDVWFYQPESQEWYNYIISLPTAYKVTYLIVVMHNQIINGGFHQYYTNMYGQFAPETIWALNEVKALRKAKILEESLSIVNHANLNDKVFRAKLLRMNLPELFVNEDLFDPLHSLDKQYYSMEDGGEEIIEDLLSEYLNKSS